MSPLPPRAAAALSSVRDRWRLVVALCLAVAVVAGGAVVWYFETPYRGSEESVADVRDDPSVTVSERGGGYVLAPAEGDSDVGLVFYPGGRVHPDAYLATLAPVVRETGATVVVPEMPLNLAVLDAGAAGDAIEDRPGVDRWYVGGHSLGGAMACRFVANHPDEVDGLVLLAAYCDDDASDADVPALVVTGTRDAVLDRDSLRENRGNLPGEVTRVRIEGMNHSQFGTYRGQPGDRPATVSDERARERVAAALVEWLRERTPSG